MLNRYFSGNVRPRIVIHQLEVFVFEAEYILYVRINFHLGEWTRLTGELQFYLFQVIQLNMCISQRVDKITRFESGDLCHHLQQQGI